MRGEDGAVPRPDDTAVQASLFAALTATWPPAECRRLGSWLLRRGEGAGGRVSAATLEGPDGDVAEAEAAMRGWGQAPLFMVRRGEAALDAALEARGYEVRDPVLMLEAPVERLAPDRPGQQVLIGPGPLAAMCEIWVAGDIDMPKIRVMQRVRPPRAFMLGRLGDRPAGAGFAAIHDGVAMLHALEVAPFARRRGVGAAITRAGAAWVRDQGVAALVLTVNRSNAAARALYDGLGMVEVGSYHYRALPGAP